ncbi:hypothetical protein GQR58_025780 [Nymphon striatum]|nr:hypothetical protein GQR58_025780 [Nymphon striatum]
MDMELDCDHFWKRYLTDGYYVWLNRTDTGYLRIHVRKTYERDGVLKPGKPGIILSHHCYKKIVDHRRNLSSAHSSQEPLKLTLNGWTEIIACSVGVVIKTLNDKRQMVAEKCVAFSSQMFLRLFYELENAIVSNPALTNRFIEELERLEDDGAQIPTLDDLLAIPDSQLLHQESQIPESMMPSKHTFEDDDDDDILKNLLTSRKKKKIEMVSLEEEKPKKRKKN